MTCSRCVIERDQLLQFTIIELADPLFAGGDGQIRAFGEPDSAIREKVEQAQMGEVKEWMINIVGAREPEDVFLTPILRDVAKFAACVINRKYGKNIDIREINKPEDLFAQLKDKEP